MQQKCFCLVFNSLAFHEVSVKSFIAIFASKISLKFLSKKAIKNLVKYFPDCIRLCLYFSRDLQSTDISLNMTNKYEKEKQVGIALGFESNFKPIFWVAYFVLLTKSTSYTCYKSLPRTTKNSNELHDIQPHNWHGK